MDVRDSADCWVRVRLQPGDVVLIPPNRFHRATPKTPGARLVQVRVKVRCGGWVCGEDRSKGRGTYFHSDAGILAVCHRMYIHKASCCCGSTAQGRFRERRTTTRAGKLE